MRLKATHVRSEAFRFALPPENSCYSTGESPANGQRLCSRLLDGVGLLVLVVDTPWLTSPKEASSDACLKQYSPAQRALSSLAACPTCAGSARSSRPFTATTGSRTGRKRLQVTPWTLRRSAGATSRSRKVPPLRRTSTSSSAACKRCRHGPWSAPCPGGRRGACSNLLSCPCGR